MGIWSSMTPDDRRKCYVYITQPDRAVNNLLNGAALGAAFAENRFSIPIDFSCLWATLYRHHDGGR